MPTRTIRRGASLSGVALSGVAPVYIDSSKNVLKGVFSGSGTTEFEVRPNIGQVVIAGDGAITIQDSTVVMTKGSAAAVTLAAPTAAQAGTRLRIAAGSAFAHVVTATALVDDGVTGGSKTTLTFGAFIGSSIELEAYNLKWVVISKNVVTIT